MPQIELVTRESVTNTNWWEVLSPQEQRTVLIETQALTEDMVTFGMSRLGIGEHLFNIREILEPKRVFTAFLRTHFRKSKATAYRIIEDFLYTKERVPEIVLRTAIARGYDIIDAEIIEKMPPPKTQDRVKIVKYLEKVDAVRKEEKAAAPEPEYDPETLMREAFNFIAMRFHRLPNNSRTRMKWLDNLFGMVMSELGVQEERTFAPVEVPEGFRAVLGRPRLSDSSSVA